MRFARTCIKPNFEVSLPLCNIRLLTPLRFYIPPLLRGGLFIRRLMNQPLAICDQADAAQALQRQPDRLHDQGRPATLFCLRIFKICLFKTISECKVKAMRVSNKWLSVAALTVVTVLSVSLALATDAFTKEQAIERALQAHPGKVEKAYQETKKGQEVWEVQIEGDDGKKWELYYTMDGKLLKEKAD